MLSIEKEKAQTAFIDLMDREIRKAETARDRKVRKAMNATADDGTEYETEDEIADAYGFDIITDSERIRLLKALEYKNDRPRLKEDHMIRFCRLAQQIVEEEIFQDKEEKRKQEIHNQATELRRGGASPLYCYCCGAIVGAVHSGGETEQYNNYANCSKARVCKDCLSRCSSTFCRMKQEEK